MNKLLKVALVLGWISTGASCYALYQATTLLYRAMVLVGEQDRILTEQDALIQQCFENHAAIIRSERFPDGH
jgi:hypothetical protein